MIVIDYTLLLLSLYQLTVSGTKRKDAYTVLPYLEATSRTGRIKPEWSRCRKAGMSACCKQLYAQSFVQKEEKRLRDEWAEYLAAPDKKVMPNKLEIHPKAVIVTLQAITVFVRSTSKHGMTIFFDCADTRSEAELKLLKEARFSRRHSVACRDFEIPVTFLSPSAFPDRAIAESLSVSTRTIKDCKCINSTNTHDALPVEGTVKDREIPLPIASKNPLSFVHMPRRRKKAKTIPEGSRALDDDLSSESVIAIRPGEHECVEFMQQDLRPGATAIAYATSGRPSRFDNKGFEQVSSTDLLHEIGFVQAQGLSIRKQPGVQAKQVNVNGNLQDQEARGSRGHFTEADFDAIFHNNDFDRLIACADAGSEPIELHAFVHNQDAR